MTIELEDRIAAIELIIKNIAALAASSDQAAAGVLKGTIAAYQGEIDARVNVEPMPGTQFGTPTAVLAHAITLLTVPPSVFQTNPPEA